MKRSNTTDCKSVGICLRRFESYTLHQAHLAQLVERIHGKDEVTGSSPVVGSIRINLVKEFCLRRLVN